MFPNLDASKVDLLDRFDRLYDLFNSLFRLRNSWMLIMLLFFVRRVSTITPGSTFLLRRHFSSMWSSIGPRKMERLTELVRIEACVRSEDSSLIVADPPVNKQTVER